MHPLTPYLYLAGALHITVILANAFLPRQLQTRAHLSSLTPILRQVFYVHWLYILIVLAGIAALCFVFPVELFTTALGRSLSGFLALFWLLRAAIRPAPARWLLILSSASIVIGMFLAAVYGIAEYWRLPLIDLDRMTRFHGSLNAFGFTLSALLAWLIASPTNRSTPPESAR